MLDSYWLLCTIRHCVSSFEVFRSRASQIFIQEMVETQRYNHTIFLVPEARYCNWIRNTMTLLRIFENSVPNKTANTKSYLQINLYMLITEQKASKLTFIFKNFSPIIFIVCKVRWTQRSMRLHTWQIWTKNHSFYAHLSAKIPIIYKLPIFYVLIRI